MINIEYFDSNLLKIDKKPYKNIDIYYIGYIAKKDFDYVRINSVNLLYLITGEADGYIEEKNGNKYLTFASTDKNKEVLRKYTILWDGIKYQIEIINGGKPVEDEQDFVKIKFLPSNKVLKLHNLTIVVRSVFEEDNNYYTQIFLDEYLYEL